MKHDDLTSQLKKLDTELDAYSFDVTELSKECKDDIRDLYKALHKIYTNKIFIDDIKNSNIRITNKIFINGKESENYCVDDKTTLYFANCKHTNVVINSKVCHIVIEKCEYLNIMIRGGSITGIDDINSKHILHIFENSSVYFVDVGNSEDCTYYISEDKALNTTISSYGSHGIKIITTDPISGITINKFMPIVSFFEIYRLYQFEKNNNLMQLYYNTSNYDKKKIIISQ